MARDRRGRAADAAPGLRWRDAPYGAPGPRYVAPGPRSVAASLLRLAIVTATIVRTIAISSAISHHGSEVPGGCEAAGSSGSRSPAAGSVSSVRTRLDRGVALILRATLRGSVPLTAWVRGPGALGPVLVGRSSQYWSSALALDVAEQPAPAELDPAELDPRVPPSAQAGIVQRTRTTSGMRRRRRGIGWCGW
jgi:hypothetical protein